MSSTTSLEGRVVLVAGAAGGLGSAASVACARAGATVVLLGRKVASLNRVYDAASAVGPEPLLYPLDLVGATPGNVCVDAAALARAAGRPVDVLFGVNLAMLVKLASLDREHLAPSELVAGALETARRTVRALRDTACGGSAEVLAQASERTRTQ